VRCSSFDEHRRRLSRSEPASLYPNQAVTVAGAARATASSDRNSDCEALHNTP